MYDRFLCYQATTGLIIEHNSIFTKCTLTVVVLLKTCSFEKKMRTFRGNSWQPDARVRLIFTKNAKKRTTVVEIPISPTLTLLHLDHRHQCLLKGPMQYLRVQNQVNLK